MKKIAVLLLIAISIICFAACHASIEPEATAAATQDTTMPTQQPTVPTTPAGYPAHYKHYGEDNGYDILFSPTLFFRGEIQVIAGEAFGYYETFVLQAYKDGEMILLADAYAQGLVSKEAIAAARTYHNQRLENTVNSGSIGYCCPAPIFSELQQRIEAVWVTEGNDTFGTWYSEENPDGDWRYYDGDILLYFGGEQEQTFTSIQLGDVTFSHPTGFQIFYFTRPGDVLVDLTAEEAPWDISEALAAAAQQHIECDNAVYGEGWDK